MPSRVSALRIMLAFACIGMAPSTLSQVFVMKTPELRFSTKIYGPFSRDANPLDWPSTFVYRGMPSGGPCTATAIGPQVILTAAHCLDGSAVGSIEIGSVKRTVSCQRHPAWPADPNADFSLCSVKPALAAPAGGFEHVNADNSATAAGTEVKLLGFGCRSHSGSDFGTLGEGDATILLRKNDYVLAGGGSELCFGDSGGGAYASGSNYQKTRRLVALNSRTDDHAWLSVTASPLFIEWATKWASDQKLAICGLVSPARNCHQ